MGAKTPDRPDPPWTAADKRAIVLGRTAILPSGRRVIIYYGRIYLEG